MIFSLIFFFVSQMKEDSAMILPSPVFTNKSIEECIQTRRSVRTFLPKALTGQQLSNILWAAQGITDTAAGFRATPSAGATYPLEILVAVKEGVFRYTVEKHTLIKEIAFDLRKKIAEAASSQMFIADAGAVIIITAVPERTTQRYGERGFRYIDNEVGHCAQNIHLEAAALGLGSVPVGAFEDSRLKEILKLKDYEDPLYIIPVGVPKDR
jgi:SagB-type dehydrogenase family enzyme